MGRVISVAVVNHGIHNDCSIFSKIHHIQILRHLWLLLSGLKTGKKRWRVGGVGETAV